MLVCSYVAKVLKTAVYDDSGHGWLHSILTSANQPEILCIR